MTRPTPDPASRGWKHTKPIVADDNETRPAWRGDAEQAQPLYRRRSRTRRLLLAFLLFGVLSGVLIWVSLWLQPARGTSVVVLYAGYEDNLAIPHNVYGANGGDALARLAGSNPTTMSFWSSGTLQLRNKPQQFETIEDWDQNLAQIREKTLLLYFAVHGGADGRGPYLLPQHALTLQSAGLGDPSKNFLRLEQVLDKLRERVPASRNIVLVLDCTQMTTSVPLGMLQNNFVKELAKLEEKIIEIPNLVVLCATDVDQRSWVSEELGKTIFAHYLIEGLKGAADGAIPGDGLKDGRINAYELHAYVSKCVSDWVRSNRASDQTPTLWPRKEGIGERRARTIHLTVVPKDYVAAVPQLRGVFVPPPALVEAWKRRERLEAQVPSPAVYAPQLWRLYQDMLLRQEELLQAGEANVSKILPGKLADLDRDIYLAQKLDLDSLGNSLALPAIAYPWGHTDKNTLEGLNRLWNAAPKDLAKEWTAIQQAGKADKVGSELQRLDLCRLALERLVENPTVHWEKTNEVLHLLDNPLQARAAEAHFLVMMHRDLVPSDPGNAISLPLLPAKYLTPAVAIRLRAERAAVGMQDPENLALGGPYTYTEQVTQWIRTAVAEADGLRRSGHDLLLASDAVNWDKGRDLLAEADKKYRQAQLDAIRIRTVLMVLDRVRPLLPYYTNWIAARTQAPGHAEQAKEDKLRQQVWELWPEVHALGDLLEKRSLEGIRGADVTAKRTALLQTLSETATRVQRKFVAIKQAFDDHCKQLDEAPGINGWHLLDNALLVPAIEPGLRAQLLTKRSARSRDLFNASLQTAAPSQWTAAEIKVHRQRARTAAAWKGFFTLAEMGKRWLDDSAGKNHQTYDQLQIHLRDMNDKDGANALTAVGEELGFRWRELPLEIATHTSAAKSADPAGNLRTADRLVRLLDGAGSSQLTDNAAQLYRQRLVQDALLWQAQRTLLDHWAAEEPSAEPYHKTAGLAFLKDVKRLDPPHEALKTVQQQLNQEQKLTLTLTKAPGFRARGPSNQVLYWTSEDEFPLQFHLGAMGSIAGLSGHPVAWVESSEGIELAAPATDQRLVQPLGGDVDMPMLATLRAGAIRAGEAKAPALPLPMDGNVVVHGLFRGQRLRLDTRLLIYPVAQTIVTTHPQPATASLAIRAPGELHHELGTSKGSLVIVLDCTGSMGASKGQPIQNSKYFEATEALKGVLHKVPRGTMVSLWVFGQAVGANKTVTNPADTIEQVFAPISWNPDDSDKINTLVLSAQAFEPWNLSPIFRAMYTAAKKDLTRTTGAKTMIVITDGMDNCFDKDEALNGGNPDTKAFLVKNFADIQVNVIGFKFAGKEEEQARKQFAAITQLPHKGNFYTVNESPDLAFHLQKLLPQKLHYSITTEDDQPVRGLSVAGFDVSKAGQDDQWIVGGLSPAAYKVRLSGSKQVSQDIALNRGDLLLMELGNDAAGKQTLQRVMYSESDFPGAISKAREGWRFAVLQNQRVHEGGLQMLMTLEKQPDTQTAALQMAKPAKVWLEVTPPPELNGQYTSRWYYQPGYPAPAWSLDVPSWATVAGGKGLARPTPRVWWSQDRLIPPGASLEGGKDFKNLTELANRALRIEENDAIIESVSVEDHLVEMFPGVRGSPDQLKTMPCLVVRMAHSRNNPLWVTVRGLDTAGEEHRFYSEAGKYTAMFWPVTADQAAKALAGIDVYSLTAFKRDAETRKCAMELRNLYEPLASEQRPMQPLRTVAGQGNGKGQR